MSTTPFFQSYITSGGTLLLPSKMDVTIKSATILNSQAASGGSVYDAWCLAHDVTILTPFTYTTYLYSSYELGTLQTSVPTLGTSAFLANLDNINWLLNWYNGTNASSGDIQGAIWKMMGNTYLDSNAGPQNESNINALVTQAMAHDGYVPDVGGKIAAVLDPTVTTSSGKVVHYQPLIVSMQAASIGDTVWHDANANGIQEAGEAGIAGATVTLVRDIDGDKKFTSPNEVLATTTTDSSGHYLFKGLTPGLDYQVVFSLPSSYDTTSPRQAGGTPGTNSDALVSDLVVLANGENNNTIDAGFYNKASLGDRLWIDANGNGQQDAGEAGVAGATVTLIGGGKDGLISTTADNTTLTTVTDADGRYAFAGLTPGAEYQMQFAAPVGTVFTAQDKGNDVSDSDVNSAGFSQIVKLVSGENNTTIDAGVYVPASLGDRVWIDANGNGQQDAGEAGVAGTTVTLIGGGADGLISTTDDNTSITTTTDADGRYAFAGLTPGVEYQVQFAAPAGTVFTAQDKGSDISDSDANNSGLSQIVKLVSGENNTTIDAGVYVPASLGDRVWIDANGNGQQDAGEAGVAGATVTLIGGGADGLISTTDDNTSITTTTDADGRYAFAGLTPGVEYQVQFAAPAGTVFTAQDKGSDIGDSDANNSGLSQIVKLVSGENNTTIDAGVYTPASLGDRVWIDANGNGQQDAGEAGVAGATVTLIGGGADGLISTTDDNTSITTTTDADGRYAFAGLTPGVEYQVQFAAPAGTVFTAQDKGSDIGDSDANNSGLSQIVKLVSGENNTTIDAGVYTPASLGDRVWIDANGNGQQDAGEAGVAGATVTLIGGGADGLISTTDDNTSITTTTDADGRYAFAGLTPGVEYQVQFAAPAGTVFTAQDKGSDIGDSDANSSGLSQIVKLVSGENNTTIDAGVYVPASLGDRVWIDANGNGQQDSGEAGVAGATVTLIGGGADGLISTTDDNTSIITTTDADGHYAFAGLTPGVEYQVQFAAPAGTVFTAQDKGNDVSDSDVNSAGFSQIVKLASGENNTTIDAGVYTPASLGDRVWIDANGNGQQDSGEAGVAGATVTLIGGGADGLVSTTADNTTASTTTDADGNYKFDGLTPGMEYQVKFSAPTGTVFTAQDKGSDVSDSDANSSGLSQIVKLTSGETNTTIDAGVYTPASLGDRVWVDANGNGQQDAGEAGVAGATVTLIGGGADGLVSTTGDNTSITTTTDANGNYQFTNLTPGMEYQVKFAAPTGTVFTAQDKGSDISDSDANSSGLSQIVKLVSGENNTTIDAGVYTPASLGDRVWIDANGNGQQDAGEAGVAGATVTLIGGGADGLVSTTADNTAVTTTTDADGNYKFDGLTPGMEYQVKFSAPTGTVFTAQDKGSDVSDSDANSSGLSQIVKLASGETNTTIDAGVYTPASLGDRVWIDANGNGQQDSGEAGVAGATVTLIGGGADGLVSTTADNTTVTTTTDADGNYKFDGLTPGMEYQVKFSAPTGTVFTAQDKGSDVSDSDANSSGLSQIVKLASGENNTTIDAGVYVPASLGDRVWVDANGNGQQDAGEGGVAGATVTLIGGGADGLVSTTADNTTVTTTTDADGNYKFDGLTPGMEYQVKFSAPTGTVFTAQDKGSDVSDSDANSSGLSQIVKLVSGENNTTIDAGVYTPASLGDRVWVDANGNGQQDAGEAGVAGATVTLIGGGADGLVSTTADNTTATTTTDANGNYKFTNLTPGMEYQVKFSAPTGTVFTAQDKGSDVSDSDANSSGLSQIVKLASGENNTTIDAGVYTPASLGDRVWIDANGNGQQDSGEAGAAGATVTLIGGGADGLVSTTTDNTTVTTTTDANGNYQFTNLTPGMEYQVKFSAPTGTVFTAQDKGSDISDSDANSSGLSQIVKLASGENNTTIDAGVYTPASLGDRVWIDANGNGQQDSGEAGAAGATVTLIGGGADGLVSTTADNTTATTTTDVNGNYKFTNLTPGMEYQVKFSAPTGTVFTAQDKGSDVSDSDANSSGLSQIVKLVSGENNTTIDAGVYAPASLGDRVWVDANGNGQQDSGEAGVANASVTLIGGGADGLVSTTADNTTATTTTDANGNYKFTNLTPGMEYQVKFSAPTGTVFTAQDKGSDISDSDANSSGLSQIVKLASGENNTTIDAGVYTPASLGDRVWMDANGNGQQDAGETGVAGVNVTLIGGGADGLVSTTADNTTVTTTTDAAGNYKFANLTPGMEYQVQATAPTGTVFTARDLGSDVSDSDVDTTTGKSQIVKLASGENNSTIDIGLAKPSGDLSITKTDGVTSVAPDQTITYTVVAKNTGTATATDAVVTDSLPSYLTNVSWTSTASAGASGNQASGTGSINDAVTLAGGASVTYTVKATVGSLASLEKVADFGSLTNNTNLGQNTTINGVHADAAYTTSTGQIGSAVLWARNSGTDKGLGVWSVNEASPTTTGSASGELSNQTNNEVIRLTLEDGRQWSSLWVSSLDKSSDGGAETGTLYWSDSATPDLSTLTTKFVFKNGDFGLGAEEGNLLSLRPAGFDAEAKYLFFVAGDSGSTAKSDYLVWKAGTIPTQITNSASITAPGSFNDTNTANNSAADTDHLSVPTPAAIVRGSIGDLVWEDMNYNGVRDSGEAGIANVTVRLLDANNNVLATTLTNSSGNYLFNNLNAGSYKIEVVEPSGYYATKANIGGNDAIDSDVDTTYGRSGVISLSQGENDLTWDAGLYRKASIGDKVWRDVDHDDIQDAGEEGIGGVKVMLYSASGTLMGTTTTNSSGNYKFANLDPGSYYLVFDKTNVMFQGTNMSSAVNMNTWKWASKDIGTNDAIDSDVAGDGVATTNVTRTDVTTLKSGENDMTWDAAITPIAIDLNGDGVHTVARGASSATFDLLGNGTAIQSGWLSSSDGFLAVDLNGNGKIDGIGELFGGSAKGDGFAKLASYDSNGDGVVDANDTAFASLVIWRDANGNHATDSGELMSLLEAGVVSLTLAHTDLPFVDAQGNLHLERSSATLANGTAADMTDVYFAIDAKDAPNAATFADLIGGNEPVVHVQVGLIGQAPVLLA
jgi:uncharacterized repeat protein (TIGR01451 family)